MNKILSSVLIVTSCALLTACGSSDGWTTIHAKKADCSFELPEPVKSLPRQDREVYESKFDDGKAQIQVGIFGKLGSPNPNATEADILNEQQKEILGQIQQNLISSGRPADLQLDMDLPVEGGLGQQVRILCGADQYIVTQGYITPRGFYFVKIDNADQNNPVVQRFMKSFKP